MTEDIERLYNDWINAGRPDLEKLFIEKVKGKIGKVVTGWCGDPDNGGSGHSYCSGVVKGLAVPRACECECHG